MELNYLPAPVQDLLPPLFSWQVRLVGWLVFVVFFCFVLLCFLVVIVVVVFVLIQISGLVCSDQTLQLDMSVIQSTCILSG